MRVFGMQVSELDRSTERDQAKDAPWWYTKGNIMHTEEPL